MIRPFQRSMRRYYQDCRPCVAMVLRRTRHGEPASTHHQESIQEVASALSGSQGSKSKTDSTKEKESNDKTRTCIKQTNSGCSICRKWQSRRPEAALCYPAQDCIGSTGKPARTKINIEYVHIEYSHPNPIRPAEYPISNNVVAHSSALCFVARPGTKQISPRRAGRDDENLKRPTLRSESVESWQPILGRFTTAHGLLHRRTGLLAVRSCRAVAT